MKKCKVAAPPVRHGRQRLKLSKLMAAYKRRHRHGEWNLGKPVGKEVW
jgi:hypothetical protein